VTETSTSRFTEINRMTIIEIEVITNYVRNISAIKALVTVEERLCKQ